MYVCIILRQRIVYNIKVVGVFFMPLHKLFCKDIGYRLPLDTHISMFVFVLWREWRFDSLLLFFTQNFIQNAKEQ